MASRTNRGARRAIGPLGLRMRNPRTLPLQVVRKRARARAQAQVQRSAPLGASGRWVVQPQVRCVVVEHFAEQGRFVMVLHPWA